MSELTHFDATGAAHMVDVGGKAATHRTAVAEGVIRMKAATLQRIRDGAAAKGDVLGVARIAGIMAAKRTAELIPLCHPVPLTQVSIDFTPADEPAAIHCTATARTLDRTGVEMEALVAVQIALLTIYDMCKSIDKGMQIDQVRLTSKSGGRSGTWSRA